jgi:hypothetical protein
MMGFISNNLFSASISVKMADVLRGRMTKGSCASCEINVHRGKLDALRFRPTRSDMHGNVAGH